jgi:hypothetical protein
MAAASRPMSRLVTRGHGLRPNKTLQPATARKDAITCDDVIARLAAETVRQPPIHDAQRYSLSRPNALTRLPVTPNEPVGKARRQVPDPVGPSTTITCR